MGEVSQMADQNKNSFNRRSILRLCAQAIATGSAGSIFRLQGASPQSQRTVVCIYLFGGNDSNNLVIKQDTYGAYASARGELALPRTALIPVTGAVTGNQYGFHPALTGIAELFNSRSLAVVANVGRRNRLSSNGSIARAEFETLSTIDLELTYLPGANAIPGWAPSEGRGRINALTHPSGRFPASAIGQQLEAVANAISEGGTGQVFLLPMSGYATTFDQLNRQAALFGELSAAMGAFYKATVDLGIANQVVTYTDTEFSRTLRPNDSGGSNRGWGGHNLVMGGDVVGGDVYGSFPSQILGGRDDVTGDGVWLPSTTKSSFTGAFSRWLGLPAAEAPSPDMNFLA